MCGPYMDRKSLKQAWDMAQLRIQGYHIHIYTNDDKGMDAFFANEIAQTLKTLFPDDVRGVYNVSKVGPHNAPNVELDITKESYGRIVQWLQMNSHGLPILVHPETGDDETDHLQSSLWINKEQGYNMAFFDRLRAGKQDAPVPKNKL